MNTVEYLSELLRYNGWANDRLIATLREHECGRALQILAHLLITQQEYFERLSDKDSTGFDFWPELPIDDCAELSNRTTQAFLDVLANGENELERVASYKTSEGISYKNTYRELLTHVLLHSSIHRGNIMVSLRASGITPPSIDYIIYLRGQ